MNLVTCRSTTLISLLHIGENDSILTLTIKKQFLGESTSRIDVMWPLVLYGNHWQSNLAGQKIHNL